MITLTNYVSNTNEVNLDILSHDSDTLDTFFFIFRWMTLFGAYGGCFPQFFLGEGFFIPEFHFITMFSNVFT